MSRRTDKAVARACHRHVCFGPMIPVRFARECLGAWLNVTSYRQGGRARLSQALLARNKRRSELRSRCAARAALDLTGKENAPPDLRPSHLIQPKKKASTRVLASFITAGFYPRISATTAASACDGFAAWLIGRPITSAARAAHRERSSLLRLFRANDSCAICARMPWRMAQCRAVQTRRSRAPVTGITGPKQT